MNSRCGSIGYSDFAVHLKIIHMIIGRPDVVHIFIERIIPMKM